MHFDRTLRILRINSFISNMRKLEFNAERDCDRLPGQNAYPTSYELYEGSSIINTSTRSKIYHTQIVNNYHCSTLQSLDIDDDGDDTLWGGADNDTGAQTA